MMKNSIVHTSYETERHNRNSAKGQSTIFKASIILLMFFVFFFGYLDYFWKYVLLLGALFLLVLSCICKRKVLIPFQKQDTFFLLYLLWGTVSLLFTNSLSTAVIYLGVWCIGFLLKLLLPIFRDSSKYIVNCMLAFSLLHVLATLFQMIFPAFITALNSHILDDNTLYRNILFLGHNAYAGITGQTGTNAFYLAVFIGIVVCSLTALPQQKNTKFVLLCAAIVAFVALIATQKRGPLLFSVIGIVIVLFILYVKRNKDIFRFTILITLFSVMIAILLVYTSYGQIVVNRFLYGSYGDISSNRFPMYILMWKGFMEQPIMGHGIASTSVLVQDLGKSTGHNIYLQSLYDIGIFGTICLLIYMYKSIERTIRMISDCSYKKRASDLVYYLLISLYLQTFILLYGLTGNPIYDHFQFFIYMIACAIPVMLSKEQSCHPK